MIEFEYIHHMSLAVRDINRSRVFYSDVLQLKEIERPPFDSVGIWYAIGEQQLHLIQQPQGETLREGNIDSTDGHLAIWVRSYRQTLEWLDQQNVFYEARPHSLAGFAQIYILDPDHNIIELDAPYEE
ncbi:glyoxylase I family protein [Paenibacillus sp. SORGH_AS306]|uniref:VOC family protein n=1 Tax=Paenibacillus kyungheensis TaxID=1452732 RepID=A0AAX3LY56_9BACL|nr:MULTISPECIES: VOC family protein [Paenibacillus]MDQ1234822.1 glyoxylase I family protein [Paenibacillus sp. SORGH_AS_0306]MDR6111869.1 glyoxylase I family protein [Paenibacillus sp. SORGH_AS_0338]WCT54406.1 VOC family protein [Paenibacillus kyungheensis]